MIERGHVIAAGLFLVVLLAGIGIGIGVDRLVLLNGPPAAHHRPPLPPPDGKTAPAFFVARLDDALDLDDAQAAEVLKILEEVEAVHVTLRPQMDAAMRSAQGKVRAVLTETQRARFDEMTRRHGLFPPHGPPGHGPPGHGPPPGGRPPPPPR